MTRRHFSDLIKSSDDIDQLFVVNLYGASEPYELKNRSRRLYSYHEGYYGQEEVEFLNSFHGANLHRIILSFDCNIPNSGLVRILKAKTATWKFVSAKVQSGANNQVRAVYQQLMAKDGPLVYGILSANTQFFIEALNNIIKLHPDKFAQVLATPEWKYARCILPSTIRDLLMLTPA
jgi:hypothetical protein